MTNKDFEFLKSTTDTTEYHKIGNSYYRPGSFGLSKHDKNLIMVGHCNDFRNKSFKMVKEELNQSGKK